MASKIEMKPLLLSLDGRITRSDYWLRFVLPATVASIVLALLDSILGLRTEAGIGFLSSIFSLILIWPSIAVAAKRWHDRGKSGWWTLILFVPVVGFFWFLVECGFLRGTVGTNRFGPDPLQA